MFSVCIYPPPFPGYPPPQPGYGGYGGYDQQQPPQQQQQQQQMPHQRGPPPPASPYGGGFPGAEVLQNPAMQNMAMQYGQNVLGQGREAVQQSMEKYMSLSRLKYYFAVDTAYVSRKLRLLFFPFTNSVSGWPCQVIFV